MPRQTRAPKPWFPIVRCWRKSALAVRRSRGGLMLGVKALNEWAKLSFPCDWLEYYRAASVDFQQPCKFNSSLAPFAEG